MGPEKYGGYFSGITYGYLTDLFASGPGPWSASRNIVSWQKNAAHRRKMRPPLNFVL
jgi:hypothetical protein